jgi:hypothetical protein
MTAQIDLPTLTSRPLTGDDASASGLPWQKASTPNTTYTLPDGYKMEWFRPAKPIRAGQPMLFTFRLTKPDSTAPKDMVLYMGMLGHAAFVATDGTVFAHIHPNGSVPMAALMLAQGMPSDMEMDNSNQLLPNTVSFPYAFPSPNRYRVFIQMKHSETIETGIFDVVCDASEKG